jgi:hypothetical protein
MTAPGMIENAPDQAGTPLQLLTEPALITRGEYCPLASSFNVAARDENP